MFRLEVDPTLCRIIEIFRHVGIWRIGDDHSFRSSCMRFLYFSQYISFCVFILLFSTGTYLSQERYQQIFLVDVQISTSVILVKLYYLLYRREEILNFLYDPIVTHNTANYGESMLVKKKMEKVAVFYKFYAVIISITILSESFRPLPIFTGDVKMLPLFIRYNSDSEYDAVFWTAFVYGAIGCFFSGLYIMATVFTSYIMYNYAIEYKLMGHRFRSLGTTTPNAYRPELIQLIQAHTNLYDTIERFRSCFATLFLAEIITGSVFVCVSVFNLSYNTPDDIFEMSVYVGFTIYAFFEVFLIMYLANEITLESDRLTYCLFESNWIDQSESTKKYVIVLCEMIKRPQHLVVIVYPMNLEKFMSIVNGAYGMFNLMKNFK